MKNPLSAVPRGAALLTAFACALVLGLAAYYYLRTTANQSYLVDRNLRLLGGMSRRIEASFDTFQSILKKLQDDERASPVSPEKIKEQDALIPDLSLAIRGQVPGTAPVRIEGRSLRLAYGSVEATSDLPTILGPIFDVEDFDELFLADAEGRVLYQTERSGIRLTAMPASADHGTAAQSAALQVTVAGHHYWLFVQPVRLAAALDADDKGFWLLGGLVTAERFRDSSLALDPSEMLLLIFGLMVAVLGLPFLKLWLLGPKDRLEVGDVLFAGFSLVVVCGALCLLFVDLHFVLDLRSELTDQTSRLGHRMAEGVRSEIDEALAQLAVLDGTFETNGRKPESRTDLPWHEPLDIHPFLNMVYWANAEGMQRAKWTVRAHNTPFISIAQREYFRRAQEGRTWSREIEVPGEDAPRRVGYYLESIRSSTTGENLVALATPYLPEPGWVSVMLTRLPTLDEPVLPPGFSFLVVDPEGLVLFHSDPTRNRQENLFQETRDDPRLRSAVRLRDDPCVTTIYHGRDIVLCTAPVAETPLVLGVLLDKAYLRTTNFEILASTAVLFGGYLLVLLLLLVGLHALAGRSRLRWAWPDRHHPTKYSLVSGILVAFGLFLILSSVLLYPRLLFAATYLLPLLALGLSLLVLSESLSGWRLRRSLVAFTLAFVVLYIVAYQLRIGRIPSDTGPWRWHTGLLLAAELLLLGGAVLALLRWRQRLSGRNPRPVMLPYLTALFLGVVFAGMLPAALSFGLVYHDHVERWVKHGQLEIARAVEAREDRLRRRYREVREIQAAGPSMLSRRIAYERDVAVAPFFDTRMQRINAAEGASPGAEGGGAPPPREVVVRRFSLGIPIQEFLANHMPFYNEISVATRRFYLWQAADKSWRSGVLDDGNILLEVGTPDAAGSFRPRLQLVSSAPRLGLGRGDRPQSWALLAAMLVALGAVVVLVARRVFLFDLRERGDELTDEEREAARREEEEFKAKLAEALVERLKQEGVVEPRVGWKPWGRPVMESARRGLRWFRFRRRQGEEPSTVEAMFSSAALVYHSSKLSRPVRLRLAWLLRECASDPELWDVGREILAGEDFPEMDRPAIVAAVGEAAEDHYRSIFEKLDEEESHALYQLAGGAMPNPKAQAALGRLLARGLLRRDPAVRPFNDSFAHYVLGHVEAEDLKSWEEEGKKSLWHRVRVPFYVACVIFAVFVFATQRDLFNTLLAAVSALTALIPAFLKLLDVGRKPAAAPPGGD